MKATQYNDTHELAATYAAADRSDPFTYSRVMSHIKSGLCDDAYTKDGRATDCRYKAEEYREERRLPPSPRYPEGEVYFVPAYKNLQRP